MNYLKLFKPNKNKIIISSALTIIWIILKKLFSFRGVCDCLLGGFQNCNDYYSYLLIKNAGCHCSCIGINEVIIQYLQVIIMPFILAYIVYSIIQIFFSKK
ncbi:MAG: hypothetical protein AABW50_00680 [Nanoarchaeota archaeon]